MHMKLRRLNMFIAVALISVQVQDAAGAALSGRNVGGRAGAGLDPDRFVVGTQAVLGRALSIPGVAPTSVLGSAASCLRLILTCGDPSHRLEHRRHFISLPGQFWLSLILKSGMVTLKLARRLDLARSFRWQVNTSMIGKADWELETYLRPKSYWAPCWGVARNRELTHRTIGTLWRCLRHDRSCTCQPKGRARADIMKWTHCQAVIAGYRQLGIRVLCWTDPTVAGAEKSNELVCEKRC